ncbi:MAG: DUF1553 domain-containing protein [Planctomycetaceae bacterium]|nr:DUF1553 domain-containing protein [Planctomycetaceae bacterium]
MRTIAIRCLWLLVSIFGMVSAASSIPAIEPKDAAGSPSPQLLDSGLHASEVTFEADIQPLLTRFGCNSGPCHGKSRGQNGFALSLLGFDSDFDYDSLVRQARGRRISPASPQLSLLIQKAMGSLPHGGGIRIEAGSKPHQLLSRWIAAGAPRTPADAPQLVRVSVEPPLASLAPEESFALQVTAEYSDGSLRDVTDASAFQSNDNTIAAVSPEGVLQAGPVTGETAVMARYMNHIALCSVTIPLPQEVAPEVYDQLPQAHPVDALVLDKLKLLNMLPSAAADDSTFHRRAYLRVIGRLPTVEETREFLADGAPNKRQTLIAQLLQQPEYGDFWANKWADLLRPNPYHVGIKATLNYDAWIREAFRENMPYDEFVKQLLTSRGSTFRDGETVMFRDRRKPDELTTIVSQLFLGIRLECAKCHHHPFEVYGQSDFYSFAAYFARIGRKGTGISAPISGSEEFIFTADKGDVQHPITNEVLEPRPIFGEAPEIAEGEDRREALAEWLASPENPYFAQTMANRVWTDLMGVGLVEPVDDLRATNPPTNPELLQALGDDFVQSDFNIKKLIRQIVLSKAYAMSTLPQPRNELDTRYYSRKYRQRLRAEVLLDSVVQVTGVPESFSAMAPNAKAKELWTHRIGSLFLDAYGRPDPNQDPPCERTGEPTVVQTLHLMNSENLAQKITSDKGQAAQWGKSEQSPEEIVNEMYLAIYARFPTESELKIALGIYENEGTDRRKVTEDLMWSLMNTPEFTFKD